MATLVGQNLLSQFRVDAFVAAGGMGSVYRVWDLKRNVPLAMKVLHSELAEDPSMFTKFQREARDLQKLGHPNIVPFYGLYNSMDVVFMLERFVDGPSLKDVLKHRKGALLPVEDTLIYFKALCAALGYAHANGVVHCDVKPGNVMVDSSGQIYLTDFGIARHAESATTTIDSAGTSAYMPPEQIRGEPVTPATDVYALGIMLYEMLTGARPFRGSASNTSSDKSTPTLSMRIRQEQLHSQVQNPRELNPEISEGLANVTLKALEKESVNRYQNAQEFFEAICAAVNISPASIADRAVLPAALKMTVGDATLPAITPEKTSKSFLPALLAGGAFIALLLCVASVIGGAFLWNRSAQTPAAPTLRATSASFSNPLPTRTSRPVTSTPDYQVMTAVALATQIERELHFTPTVAPSPSSPFCNDLRITEKPTSKGMYLMICYPGGDYEMGPWEKGNFAEGPNGQFFIYVASSGKVYATTVGEGNQIRTLASLKDKFTAVRNHDDPQYNISFSNGRPYIAFITEILYNQTATVEIPTWLSNP
ncbi:MAG: serine/threonine-protein kinase [Anaerolineales bacterium]|nr:serine/threonine-protein kinase [Anaerolineales bacterium]